MNLLVQPTNSSAVTCRTCKDVLAFESKTQVGYSTAEAVDETVFIYKLL